MKRSEAGYLCDKYEISGNRVCKILGLCRTTLDYKAHPRSDEPVASKLTELANQKRRFGHPRLFVLLKREGIKVNHKRSERIYSELGLQIKRRKRKKLGAVKRVPLKKATYANEVWAIDFMHDYLETGRRLKIFTTVDEFSKVSPGLLANNSITGKDVTEFLDTIADILPKVIKVDQGTEFTSCAFLDWAYRRGIEIQFTSVGKPNQLIESFNSRVRDECLNEHVFFSISDAREKLDQWHYDYNHFNPHSSLNMKTPVEFAKEQKAMLSA